MILLVNRLNGNFLGLQISDNRFVHIDLFVGIGEFPLSSLHFLGGVLGGGLNRERTIGFQFLFIYLLCKILILLFKAFNQLSVNLREFLDATISELSPNYTFIFITLRNHADAVHHLHFDLIIIILRMEGEVGAFCSFYQFGWTPTWAALPQSTNKIYVKISQQLSLLPNI